MISKKNYIKIDRYNKDFQLIQYKLIYKLIE